MKHIAHEDAALPQQMKAVLIVASDADFLAQNDAFSAKASVTSRDAKGTFEELVKRAPHITAFLRGAEEVASSSKSVEHGVTAPVTLAESTSTHEVASALLSLGSLSRIRQSTLTDTLPARASAGLVETPRDVPDITQLERLAAEYSDEVSPPEGPVTHGEHNLATAEARVDSDDGNPVEPHHPPLSSPQHLLSHTLQA